MAEGRVVRWPQVATSAVVLAVAHPSDRPDLDRWYGREWSGDTPGNRTLIATVGRLADWLEAEHGVRCWRIPYHIERGAVHMKDTAVLAGLGCVGRNNLLLTPEFGPVSVCASCSPTRTSRAAIPGTATPARVVPSPAAPPVRGRPSPEYAGPTPPAPPDAPTPPAPPSPPR